MTFDSILASPSLDQSAVSADLVRVRSAIDDRLEALLHATSSTPSNLHAALQHAALGPSKRIRSLLLYLVAEPELEAVQAALDLGCAVEMVHAASLVLDDLPCMDDAHMRRQKPASHLVFGESTAILSAIALLSHAFGVVARLDGVSAEKRSRMSALLSDSIGFDGLVAGQEIDVNHRAAVLDPTQIEQLNWLKTGVLFGAAAEMGAILRGLDEEKIASVRLFARHFGMAFQTADDLLDSTATSAEAGKDVGKDKSKTTLVSLFGEQEARARCQDHLSRAEAALIASGVNAAPVQMLLSRLFLPQPAAAE